MALVMKTVLVLATAFLMSGVAAQDASQLLDAMAANLGNLEANMLGPAHPSVTPVVSCKMAMLIQPGDTCASISSAFDIGVTWLLTLNPGLKCKNLIPLTSICIGGIGSSCNKELDDNGLCPDVIANEPLVPATAGDITLTEDLRVALTVQPDLYAIFTDSQTLSSLITVNGTTALVMTLPGITPVITAIEDNPGHPFVSLWSADGVDTPLVISIVPNWFAGRGGLITYVPGSILVPNGNRKLLIKRGKVYPTGSCYYVIPFYYG